VMSVPPSPDAPKGGIGAWPIVGAVAGVVIAAAAVVAFFIRKRHCRRPQGSAATSLSSLMKSPMASNASVDTSGGPQKGGGRPSPAPRTCGALAGLHDLDSNPQSQKAINGCTLSARCRLPGSDYAPKASSLFKPLMRRP